MANMPEIVPLVLLVTLPGCSAPGEPRATFAIRDSAGIEIVKSPAPLLAPGTWTIDAEPVLELGMIDGDEPHVFSRVWDATRLPDGRLVVVDEMTMQLRVFDSAGSHLLTFGGEGGGPAEFGGPAFVTSTVDGTIVAWDGGRQRMTWFSPEGELLDDVSLAEPLAAFGVRAFRNGRVWEIDASGRLLATGPTRPQRTEGLRNSFRQIVLLDDGGATSHDFGLVPSGQSSVVRLDRMSIGIGNPFAPSTRAALVAEDRVAIAHPEEWEIRLYDAGAATTRIIRTAIARQPVTKELEQRGLEGARRLAEHSPLTAGQAEAAYAEIVLPDSVPAIASIMAVDDELWVGRRLGWWYEVGDHDVFDRDGRWLTTVAIPAEIQTVLEIGSDHVLAHVQDELEVSYVRLYRLRK